MTKNPFDCYTLTMKRWVVEVDLAIKRPPTAQVTSRWVIMAETAMQAEVDAISCASQVWNAEMPVGSTIIDWEE